ncbi:FAD-binding domain-containing protein [Gigaspora margarita]|uniref:FAD-binding domain-containing protein n=1 Tax=Gigaspora margarita TaxID=4874 RepID=A0A8H4AXI7_GIGMA|nr:FAD-binding domain-containing protein [Gigaspora margarita]
MVSYLYNIFLLIVTIHASQYPLPVSKCPREDSLRKCLNQYQIKGPVIFRDNFMAYNKDIKFEYNKLFIYFPVAFVHPIDEFDVQNAVKCAAKLNIPIVARSGGHSSEGYGMGDKDCYLVVHLVNLNKFSIDRNSQTAVIGMGNTLKSLYYKVHQYGFAFPAGTCPNIGVGGHITGGGMGLLNRKFGLSTDNILDAQIVLANGTIVYNAKKYPELFWAIQGAGNAGYGIVIALTLRIYPIQKIVTSLTFEYDFDQIPLIFSVMNQLGNSFHQNLTLYIVVYSDPLSASVTGLYLGSASELQPHMQEFIKLSIPKSVSYVENDLYNIQIEGSEILISDFIKSKSFYIDSRGLSYEGSKYFMRFMKSFKCKLHSEILLIGGGRVNEMRRNESAFVHRGFLYHIAMFAHLPGAHSKHSELCFQELKNFSQHFQKNYASYENYQILIDRQLDNWQCRYYGKNFEKLVEIKRKYDPYNLFHWNQSIPTNTNISCN